jgi:hypothetical protein
LQEQRGRARLAGGVAEREKIRMPRGIALGNPEQLVPPVADRRERRIEIFPQFGHDSRERIGEIPVFALPEAVVRHHDPAAEFSFLSVKSGEGCALGGGEEPGEDGRFVSIEQGGDRRPVEPTQAVGECGGRGAGRIGAPGKQGLAHATFSRARRSHLRSVPQR